MGGRFLRQAQDDRGEFMALTDEIGISRQSYGRIEAFDDIAILLEDPRLAPNKEQLFKLPAQVQPHTLRDLSGGQYLRGWGGALLRHVVEV